MAEKGYHLSRVFLSITLAFLAAFALIAGTASYNLFKSKNIILKLSQLEQNIFFPLSRAEEDIYNALLELKSQVSGTSPSNAEFFNTFLANARSDLSIALKETLELAPEESELTIPIIETQEAVQAFKEQGYKAFALSRQNKRLRLRMKDGIDMVLEKPQGIQNELSARLLKISASDPDRLFPTQAINDISSMKLQMLEFLNCMNRNPGGEAPSARNFKICSRKISNALFILESLLIEIPAHKKTIKEMVNALNNLEKDYGILLGSENDSHKSLSKAISLSDELSTNLELCRQALATFNQKMNTIAADSRYRMALWLLFSVIIYLCTLGFAGKWLKKQVISPLEILNKSLLEIGHGKPVTRIPETRAEEISRVVRQMNSMARQLKNREESLTEAKKKWESAFQAIGGPVVLLSPAHEILECNQEFLKLSGAASLEEITGRNFSDFFSDVELEGCCPSEAHLEELKEGVRFEKTLKGRPFYLSASPVLDNQGRISGIIIVGTDLSDVKALEERLRRAQKMEAMGTLAGGVAHDLNNILTGIVTYPDILLMQLPENSPMVRPLETIQKSGQRAADVVQDLLTLARRAIGTRKTLNLNTVIKDYLGSPECRNLLMENPGIKLKTKLSPDLMNIKGSPVHLSKTVMNLFTNAVEAMPQGGEITISTKNCYLDRPLSGYDHIEPGDYIRLEIRDTGEGISSSDLPHIFEPFYTKKAMGRSGSGLGMAVVWGTVKDHNGYIDIETQIHRGTTLSVYFPVTRAQLAGQAEKMATGQFRGNERILVVDDMKEQREIASQILTSLGYRVKTAESGKKAIEICRKEAFDLLVLDMIMDPGMDGLETFEAAVKLRPGQRAIITSGFSETDRVKRAIELGAGRYIRKPYTFEGLARAVREELDARMS